MATGNSMARYYKTNHTVTKYKKSSNEYLKLIPCNLVYDKSGISNHWDKNELFNQVPGQLGKPTGRKHKFRSVFHAIQKNKF